MEGVIGLGHLPHDAVRQMQDLALVPFLRTLILQSPESANNAQAIVGAAVQGPGLGLGPIRDLNQKIAGVARVHAPGVVPLITIIEEANIAGVIARNATMNNLGGRKRRKGSEIATGRKMLDEVL